MLHIRVVKTKGNSRSVQVYRYQDTKRVIIKHIGSGTSDEQINALEEMARLFIAELTKQSYLFPDLSALSISNKTGFDFQYFTSIFL